MSGSEQTFVKLLSPFTANFPCIRNREANESQHELFQRTHANTHTRTRSHSHDNHDYVRTDRDSRRVTIQLRLLSAHPRSRSHSRSRIQVDRHEGQPQHPDPHQSITVRSKQLSQSGAAARPKRVFFCSARKLKREMNAKMAADTHGRNIRAAASVNTWRARRTLSSACSLVHATPQSQG